MKGIVNVFEFYYLVSSEGDSDTSRRHLSWRCASNMPQEDFIEDSPRCHHQVTQTITSNEPRVSSCCQELQILQLSRL